MTDKLYPPILGGDVTQKYGENPDWYKPYGLPGHEGLDYGLPIGTPIRAAHDGIATVAQGTDYGTQVWIVGDVYTTVYAHLSLARPGGKVRAGDVIGYSGNTGRSTGPHLHFGVKVKGKTSNYKDWLNPQDYLGDVPDSGKVSLHWQRLQPWAADAHKALGSQWVKIVNPQEGPDPLPGVRKLLRFWTDDFDREMLAAGAPGGVAYIERMAPIWAKYKAWGYVVYELPNEPGCNSNDELAALREFTKAAITRAHELGYMVCALNLPEGNPHDNGTGNPDVAAWKMRQLAPAMIGADYVGMHAYWCPGVEGPTGYYHALRYRENVALVHYDLDCWPHLLLNECGVDGLINGHAPYKSLSLYSSPDAYVDDAMRFIQNAKSDVYVESVFFFTAGYEKPWQDYDHNQQVVKMIADRINKASVEQTISEEAQKHIIALNPAAGFEQQGAKLGRLPAGPEFDIMIDGITYRAQAYRDPDVRDWQYIIFCKLGEWDRTTWTERKN